jgi:hypothetical protein
MNNKFLPLLFMGFLLGCQKNDDPRIAELQNQASNADSRIIELHNQLAQLSTLISNQTESIGYIWNQALLAQTNFDELRSQVFLLQSANNTVPISPQEKGFGLLKTPFGTLLVSTVSVEPYLDGYKIHLNIGNTTSANFSGLSLICSSYQTSNVFSTFQTFTNVLTDELSSGYWTPIDFILAPSDMDRVRNASVSIQLDELTLLHKPSPSS